MGKFDLRIGIRYSGEELPGSRLADLKVYAAIDGHPEPVTPTSPEHEDWTRQEIAEWLTEQARSGKRFIAGINHGFSFPLRYFHRYEITSWDRFLEDFVQHWPTHRPHVSVEHIRMMGAPTRKGLEADLRLTEKWSSSARSLFRFDMQKSSVAQPTHAGIPWLLHIRREVGDLVHFWPFDGWRVPRGKSVLAEIYPQIFRKRYPQDGRAFDQQDACATARWLREMDERGFLERYFNPPLTDDERKIAELEGWFLGIM